MIILLAGLQNVPGMYYEAAKMEGASSFQCFRKITVPLITPSLFFVIIMEFMNSLKVFDLIYIFINSSFGPIENAARTMVYGIYQKAFVHSRMGYASAEAVHKSHTMFARSPPVSSANFAPFTVNFNFMCRMPFSA